MRLTILAVLRALGIMRLWRFLHRHEVTILYLHGVMESRPGESWVPLRPQFSPRRLAGAIRTLSRFYRFVSLDEAVEMLAGRKPLRPYSMVLTFDDGYRNNVTHALPILRAHGVPAAIYLAAGHVEERRPFWVDRLDYALQQGAPGDIEVSVGPRTMTLHRATRGLLRDCYRAYRDAAKREARHDIEMLREVERLAARLEAESGRRLADIFEHDDWTAVLTWEEVKTAAAPDLIFGGHTVDHVRLARVDADTIRDQLTRCREMVEARTGRPCVHLAYPNGSYSREAVEIARACGYRSAVTTEPGRNRIGDDLMTLRRYNLPDTDSELDLLARVAGFSVDVAQLFRRACGLGTARRPPAPGQGPAMREPRPQAWPSDNSPGLGRQR
jgi:peptidoglycan/xylan/chitin deacetylase (PgdA/CDA1 family)